MHLSDHSTLGLRALPCSPHTAAWYSKASLRWTQGVPGLCSSNPLYFQAREAWSPLSQTLRGLAHAFPFTSFLFSLRGTAQKFPISKAFADHAAPSYTFHCAIPPPPPQECVSASPGPPRRLGLPWKGGGHNGLPLSECSSDLLVCPKAGDSWQPDPVSSRPLVHSASHRSHTRMMWQGI